MQHVICIGSWQGSDAAAWVLAEQLEAHLRAHPQPALQIHRTRAPIQMLNLFKGVDAVLLIDATPDLPPGRVELIARKDLRSTPNCSSHGLDLVAALDLIEALGELPPRVRILALGVGAIEVAPDWIAEQALPGVLTLLRTVDGMHTVRARINRCAAVDRLPVLRAGVGRPIRCAGLHACLRGLYARCGWPVRHWASLLTRSRRRRPGRRR